MHIAKIVQKIGNTVLGVKMKVLRMQSSIALSFSTKFNGVNRFEKYCILKIE